MRNRGVRSAACTYLAGECPQYVSLYRFGVRQIVEGWEHTDTSYAFSRLSMVAPGSS
jgi:hypothetical protein